MLRTKVMIVILLIIKYNIGLTKSVNPLDISLNFLYFYLSEHFLRLSLF